MILSFKWEITRYIYVRRRTCKGCDMCYAGDFLNCVNDKECGPWIKTVVTTKEGRTRERKVHPVCKDPSLKTYLVNNFRTASNM